MKSRKLKITRNKTSHGGIFLGLNEKLAWDEDDKPTLILNNEDVSIKDMGKSY